MGVQILKQETVQASTPERVQALGDVFPLGPLDALVSTAVPISVCFVYRSKLDPGRIATAARQLLDNYPQLTGRLSVDENGAPSIDRLGTGATLRIAHCDGTIADTCDARGRVDLLKLPDGGNDLLVPFDHARFDTEPLLTIQCTSFSDGTVLGVRCHHMVCDGTGYFQLVGHLAELYSNGTITRPPVIHPYRPSGSPAKEPSTYSIFTEPVVLAGTPVAQQAPVVGRFIHLDQAYLTRLKDRATPIGGRTSTFAAILALFYQITHRARRILYTRDSLSSADLLVSVNLRNKTPHLPADYFPNAVMTPNDKYDSDALFEGDLREVTAYVNSIIRDQVKPEDINDTIKWLHAQTDKTRIDTGFRFANGAFACAQWSGFDLYSLATFDDERPCLVAPPFTVISLCNGLLYTLPPVPTGDGKEDGLLVSLALSGPLWDVIDERGLMNAENIGMSLALREHAMGE